MKPPVQARLYLLGLLYVAVLAIQIVLPMATRSVKQREARPPPLADLRRLRAAGAA